MLKYEITYMDRKRKQLKEDQDKRLYKFRDLAIMMLFTFSITYFAGHFLIYILKRW